MYLKVIKNICIFAGVNIVGMYCYIQYKKKSSGPKLNIVLDLDETIIHTDNIVKINDLNMSNALKSNNNICSNPNSI